MLGSHTPKLYHYKIEKLWLIFNRQYLQLKTEKLQRHKDQILDKMNTLGLDTKEYFSCIKGDLIDF